MMRILRYESLSSLYIFHDVKALLVQLHWLLRSARMIADTNDLVIFITVL